MAERIEEEGELIAILVPASDETDGISFFTSEEESQQLGLMNRPEGYSVEPHRHPERERVIESTDEILFVREGRLSVELYGKEEYSRTLEAGDVILMRAPHSVEMLEDSEVVAVKQGPYVEDGKEEL